MKNLLKILVLGLFCVGVYFSVKYFIENRDANYAMYNNMQTESIETAILDSSNSIDEVNAYLVEKLGEQTTESPFYSVLSDNYGSEKSVTNIKEVFNILKSDINYLNSFSALSVGTNNVEEIKEAIKNYKLAYGRTQQAIETLKNYTGEGSTLSQKYVDDLFNNYKKYLNEEILSLAELAEQSQIFIMSNVKSYNLVNYKNLMVNFELQSVNLTLHTALEIDEPSWIYLADLKKINAKTILEQTQTQLNSYSTIQFINSYIDKDNTIFETYLKSTTKNQFCLTLSNFGTIDTEATIEVQNAQEAQCEKMSKIFYSINIFIFG